MPSNPAKETEILSEIRGIKDGILDLKNYPSVEEYLQESERLHVTSERLHAKYLAILQQRWGKELARRRAAGEQILDDSALVEKMLKTSLRYHTYIGSGIKEEDLNEHFGSLIDVLGPEFGQLFQELDDDVFQLVRESKESSAATLRTKLQEEREALQKIFGDAETQKPEAPRT